MTPGRVSIIIPSRNEQFHLDLRPYPELQATHGDAAFVDCVGNTVRDVLAHATGDIEVIPVLDGYWPDPPIPSDPRVRILHKGAAEGMRPAINDGVRVATGEFLLKLDAHCSISAGFDEQLKQDYAERNWVMIPRRDRLEWRTWGLQDSRKPPIDAHYLSYPFAAPINEKSGLHGTIWPQRSAARKHILIDDEMSSQGSCWFMHRDQWERLGELEVSKYGNFIQEFQEVGCKTWLGGGAVKVNKKVTYLHLHKGPVFGRGYHISRDEMRAGQAFAVDYWMHDRWAERTHDLRWLVEHFAPVPGWPEDLDEAFRAGC